jgi:hypothetical protein
VEYDGSHCKKTNSHWVGPTIPSLADQDRFYPGQPKQELQLKQYEASMARQETILSVFVASPSDVDEERNRLEEVIRELNTT